jgi:hypothetical protein
LLAVRPSWVVGLRVVLVRVLLVASVLVGVCSSLLMCG